MKKGNLNVQYVGGRWRQAYISFTEDREEEFQEIRQIMETDYGWQIDQCDMCGQCCVYDRDEYETFMENWKECKKAVRESRRARA